MLAALGKRTGVVMRKLMMFGALMLAGCATTVDPGPFPALVRPSAMLTPGEALTAGVRPMTSVEAVIAAASASGAGVRGVFTMVVRRAEPVGPRFFLNSETDYRDQRSLSIAVHPSALPDLRARYGGNLRRAFLGKDVRVYGYARRQRIDFTVHGRPTGKYYYQTHVTVTNARQVDVR
jgi:hypothetical protein